MKDIMGSIANYKQYLEGLDFPASKMDIIDHLQDKNAPDTIISIAEKIPDKVYDNMDDVVGEVKNKL